MGEIQQDPSMEEILASIKRVIAEDGRDASRRAASTATARPRRIARPEPAPEEDVLELDDPVSEGPGLLSEDAAAASRERLASLSALRQRSEAPAESGALEAVVREMLRPILKEWLDAHLPEIVEELVTREIARITGRDL
jgi:cell pole-organizing protein PopZ